MFGIDDAIIGSAVGSIASGLLGGGGSSGGSQVTLNPLQEKGGKTLLDAINLFSANQLANSADQYGKQAAIADTQGFVKDLFDQFSKTALPALFQNEASSGGYNGTTGQLMANDAFAQTISKAQAGIIDTILKYRQTEQNDFTTLAKLVGAIPGGTNTANGTDPNNGKLWGSLIGAGVGSLGTVFGGNSKPEQLNSQYPVFDYGQYF